MRGCDAVIHLAAVADVDEVALDPLRAVHEGTELAADAGLDVRVVVPLVSSRPLRRRREDS